MSALGVLLGKALRQTVQHSPLRRLMLESVGFGVAFNASKDYLQPILKQAAIALPILLMLEAKKRTAQCILESIYCQV